jgi:hypothetical protein
MTLSKSGVLRHTRASVANSVAKSHQDLSATLAREFSSKQILGLFSFFLNMIFDTINKIIQNALTHRILV